MTTGTDLPQLPFDRPEVLGIGPDFARLRGHRPVTRVLTPAGDPAWLVTGYAEARQLFSDDRLGRSHPHPEQAARISASGFMGGPTGNFSTEQADHARLRRLLAPAFSAKRMRRLEADVQALADGLIDDMIAAGADGTPVDLQEHLSAPLPIFVICTLLGVPYADRAHFRGLSERAATLTGDDPLAALIELMNYTADLAEAKRRVPGEDVISDLVAAQAEDATFDNHQLAQLVAGLLFAGHETTLHRISVGVLLLLENAAARHAVAADPASASRVVDEVLRLAAPGDFGLARYARADITVGEGPDAVTIAAGDAVILATLAANRDPDAFVDAEMFDATRSPNPHLTFGHGSHFCIGASLARTELRIALGTLFTRLPDLRLAVGPDRLRLHTDRLTGGLHDLWVTW
ncbi:cytochrome P450 [Umezawaea sp. Da 62-37]|uniref:cytochrome P450 n=1 Tax=Umezawaea sp. Da 62-37 TaxID=3075927 RepID=UPI0028F7165C|nr:cytochrome P450 [Umezawaea sp. Da 62-37]WNV82999.1 cytochrome P450 [Umezawaea sp. Da 62-37]